MTKKRASILLTVLAIAVDVTAMVLLIPTLPTGASGDLNVLLTSLIAVGLVLGLASATLRRQAKEATHQADGA